MEIKSKTESIKFIKNKWNMVVFNDVMNTV